jgi:predicted secreted hydrolase
MAHFAVSDIEKESFRQFERLNRAGIGWAGAETERYRVWNEDWEASLDGTDHVLAASEGRVAIDLRLAPLKPEVLHGEAGISRKGMLPGNASHYVSSTRLGTVGTIAIDDEKFAVQGLSWMDHEFGTSFLEPNQVGWDWFSVQLDDGRDLMFFQLRRADGAVDPNSSGTLIEADGRSQQLRSGEFRLVPGVKWRSPKTGAEYPVEWMVESPGIGLRLRVRAVFADQEMSPESGIGVTYWEGSVGVEGQSNGETVGGRGYLEMTGYAGLSMSSIMR